MAQPVAHRLSTVQHAERILVMHKVAIRERSTHQELLALDGLCRRLYDLQHADQERRLVGGDATDDARSRGLAENTEAARVV